MGSHGYYMHPTLHGDHVVFVSENDLWTVPRQGGVARRLTAGLGSATRPHFSPDGSKVAFTGREEGHWEVYVLPGQGGPAERLTYLGGSAQVVGWRSDDEILFVGDHESAFRGIYQPYSLSLRTRRVTRIPVGPAGNIQFNARGACVILRSGMLGREPAHWKRYRGGTAGDLWIDPAGKGDFRRLLQIKGHVTSPLWMGDRVGFLSDHEGVGNLYSCRTDGTDLRRHTRQDEYFARNATTDGRRVIYHAGADLHVHDPHTGKTARIEFGYPSPRTQRNRRYSEPDRYLESVSPHPKGHSVAAVTRGKLFAMGNWEGPSVQLGEPQGVRYRLARYLHDGKRVVAVSDASGEDGLEIFGAGEPAARKRIAGIDVGRVTLLQASPVADLVALTNHRNEVWIVDLRSGRAKRVDRCPAFFIAHLSWSPDGRWLAYDFSLSERSSVIRVCDVRSGKVRDVTQPVLRDMEPVWDPDGKYLYFISYRTLDPVYDSLHFDLGFPMGGRPYLITLRRNEKNPFLPSPEDEAAAEEAEAEGEKKGKKSKKASKRVKVDIDFEGIEDRILEFPVEEALYDQLGAAPGKVFMSAFPVAGAIGQNFASSEPESDGRIFVFEFESRKRDVFVAGISSFTTTQDGKHLVYRKGNDIRVLPTAHKPELDPLPDEEPSFTRKSGWIDLERLKVMVDPVAEWRQMYGEAWRLQRDQFWTPDMSRIDWKGIYRRYLPLLDRVSSRSEFSDLLWEMQGELGTSHAYDWGGDYRAEPDYGLGFLGADFELDRRSGGYRVKKIHRGDPWDFEASSPLVHPGVDVRAGDVLVAIQGRPLGPDHPPGLTLMNQADSEVKLTFVDGKTRKRKEAVVRALYSERRARYRDWVETNRRHVHRISGGRVGYVHVPDMGAAGYAEFHRYYLAELEREGLIVDVRFNGGGHVSSLLLEKLARKRIAFVETRWFGRMPYPEDSTAGPMVALTNEYAGSDGDIFSHAFKLLGLGPLIGKRTWGGVIGIWPRHPLVDGGVTTQPEFSFWFKDVGWRVENFGTEPDIDVDIRPQDYRAGKDPQLDRALLEVGTLMRRHPESIMKIRAPRPSLRFPDAGPRPKKARRRGPAPKRRPARKKPRK